MQDLGTLGGTTVTAGASQLAPGSGWTVLDAGSAIDDAGQITGSGTGDAGADGHRGHRAGPVAASQGR
jgi:hypothetical protein